MAGPKAPANPVPIFKPFTAGFGDISHGSVPYTEWLGHTGPVVRL